MRLRWLSFVLLMSVLLTCVTAWAKAEGKPSAMIGFKRGEHPRIWITKNDLPGLRKRCAPGGSHEREFKRLKQLVDADGYGCNHVNTAFLYLMTGERKYAKKAKDMLLSGKADKQAGVALDWIMTRCDLDTDPGDPVTRDELKMLVDRITSNGTAFQFWSKGLSDWNTKKNSPNLWERILWFDPAAKEVDLESIPTAAHWPGNGYNSFRSGWCPDDTVLFFVAGDHVSGRMTYGTWPIPLHSTRRSFTTMSPAT